MARYNVTNGLDDYYFDVTFEAEKVYVTPAGNIVFGTVDEYWEFDEVVAVFPATAIVRKLEDDKP